MAITLRMRSERRFLRLQGSETHIDFQIQVEQVAEKVKEQRIPLTLALVLDRSGSMAGGKINTAKKAALTLLDHLDERDQIAVVVYDDQIDTVQALTKVTPAAKTAISKQLEKIEARGATALHEGWLTGCNAIAGDALPGQKQGLSRCFLLTDGLANQGLTDTEQIAVQAGGIRSNAGISTSTFGIGEDYNEALLGPMAVAGGGQFHHLRKTSEIVSTFMGELGELFSVLASQVCLEIEVREGVTTKVISAYWSQEVSPTRQSLTIGDLLGGEERHVIVNVVFPEQQKLDGQTVRARIVWQEGGQKRQSDWQELWLSYADERLCEKELPDPHVVQLVGEQKVDQAKREALKLNQQRDQQGAQQVLREANVYLQANIPYQQGLQTEADGLSWISQEMEKSPGAPMAPGFVKEAYYQSHLRSRAQRDHRAPKDPEEE
jgi:Ca-activated chloride channel family protein